MNKKLVSIIASLAMSVSLIPQALAAPTYFTQDYSSLSGSVAWNGHLAGTMTWSTGSGWSGALSTYGYAFEVKDGVYGKVSGDKSLQWSLKNVAGNKAMRVESVENTTDGATYYTQSSVYIGEAPDEYVFRTGGEGYLGTSRKTAYLAFGGDGVVYKDARVATDNVRVDGYDQNNWYTVTMAYTANDGVTNVMDVYIDGKKIDSASFDGSAGTDAFSNAYMYLGWNNEGTTYYDEKFYSVLDDIKVVEGAFDPTSTNTDISSVVYTVSNPTFLESGSNANPKVSNIPGSATAGDVIENITAPQGGSVYVAKIGSDGATEVLGTYDLISDNCVVVSKAAGGNIKLYEIETYLESTAEANVEACEYTLDADTKTISDIPRFTSIERLLSDVTLSAGATAKVISIIDTELTEGYINDTMRLRVTSNDGTVSNDYALQVSTANATDLRSTSSYLKDKEDGVLQTLIGYAEVKDEDGNVITRGASSNRYTRIDGFYGGVHTHGLATTDTTSVFTYSKVTQTDGTPAYEFENPTTANVYRKTHSKSLTNYNASYGDDLVVQYSIKPETIGRYVTAFRAVAANATDGSDVEIYPESVTGRYSTNISFEPDGKIYFGSRENAIGRGQAIGSWTVGEEYDMVIVMKKLAPNDEYFYVRDVYINDVAIDWTGMNATTVGEYHRLNAANTFAGIYPAATTAVAPTSIQTDSSRNQNDSWEWDYMMFSASSADGVTPGRVEYSDICAFMANDYEPEKEIEVSISSDELEVYENDKILNKATIKGFSGTVADVKAALDVTDGAVIRFFTADGELITDESVTAEAGMTAQAIMVDGTAKKSYMLSDRIDFGTYKVYDSTGILEIESLEEADGAITIQRTVKEYNAEDITNYTMIVAVYDMQDRLKDLQVMTQDDYDPENDGLYMELDLSEYANEEIKVKAMLLDTFAGMMPYSSAMIITNEGITGNTAENTNFLE